MKQASINHRPRKQFSLKTQYKVFHQSLNRVALRTLNHRFNSVEKYKYA
jgi:hypothetical protein